jgi:hypothetical protein
MKRPYPAEKSRLLHQRSSRAFRFGDFRPGCLIFWLFICIYTCPLSPPFADDWLFRSFVDFTVPLFDPIALKLLLANL